MSNERLPLPYAWDDVKRRLQGDMRRLVDRLGFHDKPDAKGAIWPLNPRRADRKAGSFRIQVYSGSAQVGVWKDFALSDAQGDVFGLIEYVQGLQTKMDVYWWALDFLNLPGGPGANTPRSKAQAQLDNERLEADRQAFAAKRVFDEAANAEKMLGLWLGCKPFKGTVVETYLREARKIDLDLLPRLPKAPRFHPALEHRCDDTGEITEWPAMVTCVTRAAKVVGVHRTYLLADGSGKAPVFNAKGKSVAKKMLGQCGGGAMRLSNGARDIRINEAAAAGYFTPLIIGEGIETTLTVATAQPGYRAWAAGSLSLIGLLDWPECANALFLLGENDGSDEAAAAFAKACDKFQGQAAGRPFKAIWPEAGHSDHNDMVRAA